jgi:thiol-disulfide isomerase/thioredoxin/YHS domain-containing protein
MPVTRWMGIVMALAGAVVPSQGVVAQSAKADSGWMQDFDTAQSESQRLNRPLLIHFHADWCVPCRRMDRDVLSSPELAEQFQQAFVGVKVDADQHPELLKRFGVRSLPADVVVSPDGKLLIQTRGYQEKKTYVARLDQLGQRFQPPQGTPVPLEKSDGSMLARDQNSIPPVPPAKSLQGLDGFSPVSLFNWREWRKGEAQFTAYYKGVAYQMVTREELDEFTANPDKYVPRLLGCDPVILLQSDRAVQGNTKYGAYFDGALYLFQGPETRAEFKKAPMRYIKTRHVLNVDEIESGETRQSAKPADPSDPVRQ